MIKIIGDTIDELADIQKLVEIGTLNSNEEGTIDFGRRRGRFYIDVSKN